jgi:hypothetical protein
MDFHPSMGRRGRGTVGNLVGAIAGAVGIGLALIAEEILVTSKGGAGQVAGAFGTLTRFIEDVSNPNVPGIPNRADAKKG